MEKICKECNKIKKLLCFHKRKRNKDGYKNKCIECYKKKSKKPRKKICEECRVSKLLGRFEEGNNECMECHESFISLKDGKNCSKCKIIKPKRLFTICRSNKDGLSCWCKKCNYEKYKKYKKTLKTREIPLNFKNIVKKCPKCKRSLSGVEFQVCMGKKDFLQTYCKDCCSSNRLAYLNKKKVEMGGKCNNCGFDNINFLEFDHLGDKIHHVSRLRKRMDIDLEVKKCQLLCLKCHRKKSAKEKRKSGKIQHKKYKYINKVKLIIGKCQVCDAKIDTEDEFDLSTFDFDHLEPLTKSYNVADIPYTNIQKIQKEIDKCRLLCCFCHKKITCKKLFKKN